jgi:hypothetical protein
LILEFSLDFFDEDVDELDSSETVLMYVNEKGGVPSNVKVISDCFDKIKKYLFSLGL